MDADSMEPVPLVPEIDFLDRLGLDRELLNHAFAFSRDHHVGQTRKSGEPFIRHALEVARILDDLKLDSVTIAAGLLHDTVEDTDLSIGDIQTEFGEEVAHLVDAVTKIGELQYKSPEMAHAENYRKMLLCMARDIRVILIKLADRLHNMRTLHYLPDGKIERISRETLEIYAPLAHRFGIAKMKWELEDLAFKYLEEEPYQAIVEGINSKRRERELYIEEFNAPLRKKLEEAEIDAEITGRPKHFYSIWRKMQTQDKSLEEIYDLLAIRVVTKSVKDCYHVLGIIHTLYTPVHDRIKDFIATPKSNMYQSLHTTVIGPRGEMVEIQIRTLDMHATSEYGIAAHWKYKEKGKTDSALDERMGWLRQVLDWEKDTDPGEFLDLLRTDLFQQEVFVFTPQGDLRRLAKGATALDFAFDVHTEVGFRCVGARVNGQIVPIRCELKNGETVEIITSKSARPTQDWLEFVRTSGARSKIRRWLRQANKEQATQTGKEMLEREFRYAGIQGNLEKVLKPLCEPLGYQSPDQLIAAVGRGDLTAKTVASRLKTKTPQPEIPAEDPLSLEKIIDLTRRSVRGVRLQGVDNLMIRFANCCQPLPGDRITGIITRGRGVSIHKHECPNASSERVEENRLVPVDWDVDRGQTFPVKLVVFAADRHSLLGDIARAIGKIKTNIRSADMTSEETDALGTFIVEISSLDHLAKVQSAIKKVRGVTGVERRELI